MKRFDFGRVRRRSRNKHQDENEIRAGLEIVSDLRGSRGISVTQAADFTSIQGRPPGTIVLFRLTEDLNYPDPARYQGSADEPSVPWTDNAEPEVYDSIAYVYRAGSDWVGQTLYHPTCFKNANGIAIGHASCRTGDRVWAKWNRQSERWEILLAALDLWRFELKTDLSAGGSATAYLILANGARETDVEFTVVDMLDMFYGDGSTESGASGSDEGTGAKGYCKFFPDANQREIIQLRCP